MPQVMATPSLHSWLFPLKDLDVLVNLASAQGPPKLTHGYLIRDSGQGLQELGQALTHANVVVEAVNGSNDHVFGEMSKIKMMRSFGIGAWS